MKPGIGLAQELVGCFFYARFLELFHAGIRGFEETALLVYTTLEAACIGKESMTLFFGKRGRRASENFRGNGVHAHKQIEAIAERAGKPGSIGAEFGFRAGARPMWMPQVTTRAWIAGGDQQNICGEASPFLRALQTNFSFFKRLAQAFQGRPRKLRDFIEKQDAAMGSG